MDPSEGEFLAERETIDIIPNFSHNKLYLISGDVGPFKAGNNNYDVPSLYGFDSSS